MAHVQSLSGSGIVTDYWIGMRNGVPYIMVAVEKGICENPEELVQGMLALGIACGYL